MKRTVSGIVYILLLAGFYCLKVFVHDLCFDVLVYFASLVGTYEMVRATKQKTCKAQRITVMIFAGLAIPACAIAEGVFLRFGMHVISILFFVLAVALIAMFVINYEEISLESVGVSFLSAVYPGLLLCLLVQVNHVPDIPSELPERLKEIISVVAFRSDVLFLFILGVSSLADTFAFLFGMTLKKKFPKKFAPAISPNKTVVGTLGGLFGGIVGGVVLYFLYNGLLGGSFAYMQFWLPVYVIMGLLTAVATAFGDLVESGIKRKVGIKDMGKIMPGHGGVLDRIDGTMFATMIVYLCYIAVRMLFIYIL